MIGFSQLEKTVELTEYIQLFEQVFIDSEGEQAGEMIGQLVYDLLTSTPSEDLYAFIAKKKNKAEAKNEIIGGVIFSRVLGQQGINNLFILSPMAIKTSYQGQTIGQQLIHHGIAYLRDNGVETLLTYGDPRFYGKVGFIALDQTLIAAPFPLSFPHGWLVQSLNNHAIEKIEGPVQCVPALMHERYW